MLWHILPWSFIAFKNLICLITSLCHLKKHVNPLFKFRCYSRFAHSWTWGESNKVSPGFQHRKWFEVVWTSKAWLVAFVFVKPPNQWILQTVWSFDMMTTYCNMLHLFCKTVPEQKSLHLVMFVMNCKVNYLLFTCWWCWRSRGTFIRWCAHLSSEALP